jgi:ATP-dependent Lon protease
MMMRILNISRSNILKPSGGIMVISFKKFMFTEDEMPLPAELPIVPLRDTVVYPDFLAPFLVGRKKTLRTINDAISGNKLIGILTQKIPHVEDPDIDDLYNVGCVARIMKMVKRADGSEGVVVQGICRFKSIGFSQKEPYLKAGIIPIFEDYKSDPEIEARYLNLHKLFSKAIELAPGLLLESAEIMAEIDDPGSLANLVATTINISVARKQEILEKACLNDRLQAITAYLEREIETLELNRRP